MRSEIAQVDAALHKVGIKLVGTSSASTVRMASSPLSFFVWPFMAPPLPRQGYQLLMEGDAIYLPGFFASEADFHLLQQLMKELKLAVKFVAKNCVR